jgi:hypothetical protein
MVFVSRGNMKRACAPECLFLCLCYRVTRPQYCAKHILFPLYFFVTILMRPFQGNIAITIGFFFLCLFYNIFTICISGL